MRALRLVSWAALAFHVCSGCGSDVPDKNEIVIGQSWSLTGAYANGAKVIGLPVYDMWIDEVNADGGIFVRQYNKKLKIRLIRYDDESSDTKMVSLLEKLVVDQKVDMLFPPWGSNNFFPAGPVANMYKK